MVRRAKSEFIHRGSSFLLENLAHKEWSLFLTNANQKLSGEHISFKWAQLHHNDDIKRILIQACQSLEILALHFFSPPMVGRLVYGLPCDTLLIFSQPSSIVVL